MKIKLLLVAMESEFIYMPYVKGSEFEVGASIALISRLKNPSTATSLGFTGFEGKKVLDVGTRD